MINLNEVDDGLRDAWTLFRSGSKIDVHHGTFGEALDKFDKLRAPEDAHMIMTGANTGFRLEGIGLDRALTKRRS